MLNKSFQICLNSANTTTMIHCLTLFSIIRNSTLSLFIIDHQSPNDQRTQERGTRVYLYCDLPNRSTFSEPSAALSAWQVPQLFQLLLTPPSFRHSAIFPHRYLALNVGSFPPPGRTPIIYFFRLQQLLFQLRVRTRHFTTSQKLQVSLWGF